MLPQGYAFFPFLPLLTLLFAAAFFFAMYSSDAKASIYVRPGEIGFSGFLDHFYFPSVQSGGGRRMKSPCAFYESNLLRVEV
jgi:hypothetical protein